MSDYMTKPLTELVAEITADGVVDAAEAKQIRERVFADGRIDKEEAEFLFAINNAVSGKANDSAWNDLFVEAIAAYVLNDEKTPGVVDDEEAQYLIAKMQADAQVDQTELAALVQIAATAKSTPDALQTFTLAALKTAILADGVIAAEEVAMLRKVIYGAGGAAGAGVARAEADFLFDLNDAVSGKANDPSWPAFFVEAISKHLLEDPESPGKVDDAEADWLIGKIEGDKAVDDTEKALLQSLQAKAAALPEKLKFKLGIWRI